MGIGGEGDNDDDDDECELFQRPHSNPCLIYREFWDGW